MGECGEGGVEVGEGREPTGVDLVEDEVGGDGEVAAVLVLGDEDGVGVAEAAGGDAAALAEDLIEGESGGAERGLEDGWSRRRG